ncbi:unnamed protein product [Clonostachys rhizophaga]|uniref:Uncharacterized protein n=1 Tax=Clonostachys rhizophaga TaxID=160324 RepID=A0A9N9V2Q0_9HYPO|nr:unnamed protein product [Clonostachys rhizophaga]
MAYKAHEKDRVWMQNQVLSRAPNWQQHLTDIRNVLVEIHHKKLLSQAGVNSLLTIMLYGLEGFISEISSPLRICMYRQGNVYVPAFYRAPPTNHQYLPVHNSSIEVCRRLSTCHGIPPRKRRKQQLLEDEMAAEPKASIQSHRIPKPLVRDPPYHPTVASLFNNRENIYVNRVRRPTATDVPPVLSPGPQSSIEVCRRLSMCHGIPRRSINWQLAQWKRSGDDPKFWLKHMDDKGDHIRVDRGLPPAKLVDENYNIKSIVNWQLARFVPTEEAFDPVSSPQT